MLMTALVISAENEAALESKLVQVVKLSCHWCECNNLKMNLTKSFLMHIRTNHLTRNLWNLMLQEESVKDLTVINDVKFLGLRDISSNFFCPVLVCPCFFSPTIFCPSVLYIFALAQLRLSTYFNPSNDPSKLQFSRSNEFCRSNNKRRKVAQCQQ